MDGFGIFATAAFFIFLSSGLCFIALKSQEQAQKLEKITVPPESIKDDTK